jgi:hypothetical protein
MWPSVRRFGRARRAQSGAHSHSCAFTQLLPDSEPGASRTLVAVTSEFPQLAAQVRA